MPIPILMPALSPTMEEGTLAKWHVSVGDEIASGDVIAEIETDKATMEVEAVEEGRIGKICVEAGTSGVPVNSTIAFLLEDGEDAAAIEEKAGQQGTPADKTTDDKPDKKSAPDKTAGKTPQKETQPEEQTKPAHKETVSANNERIIASPLARRIAAENKLDLAAITGTGPRGRIIKADVEKAIKDGTARKDNQGDDKGKGEAGQPASKIPLAPPVAAGDAVSGGQHVAPVSDKEIFATYEEGTYDLVEIDNMRRTVADRLTLSKSTIPHFYLTVDCALDELLKARKRLNDAAPKEGPGAYKLSVNDFIIKALALALQYVPAANATWSGKGILLHKRSDISVAVAVEGGLYTPVIRHADLKTLSEISNEMKDLAIKARQKKLSPADYVGGSTSISNLGMMGIKKFDAVINPPQSTILAVGAGEERPVIIDKQVEVRTMMTVTLSCDHRVVDGALGAELLNVFKGFIEEPVTMLV